MLRSRFVYFLGWCLLIGGLAGVCLHAQDRASDVLKKRTADQPIAEESTEETLTNEASSEAGEISTVAETPEPIRSPVDARVKVVSVEISETIDGPNVYILRRAIKTAIEQGADVVILEIDTPGGYGSSMLEMMETIQRFEGTTIAFINNEAMSAGAFISFSADEIWYVPDAIIGSAAVVSGSGQDIAETMRQKIDSYIRAKIRSVETVHPHKAKVMRAMMDADYELKIDGKVPRINGEPITKEGELLSLTAAEAMHKFGRPPTPLFGEGIAHDIEDLLNQHYGAGNWELTRLEVTWSEQIAKYLKGIGPLLVALGILAIFIEVKTPGFGFFGIAGILLLGIVFATNYIIGLAGWEAFIVMFIGLALIAIDIFFLPGTMVLMIVGACMALGALIWSLTDVWPTVDGGIDIEMGALVNALTELSISVLLGTVGLIVLWRLLPQTGIFDRLVLKTVSASDPGVAMSAEERALPAIGTRGVVTRPLHPGGEVEIDGHRYQARVDTGTLSRDEAIVVVRHLQFGLEVRKDDLL